MGDYNPQKKGWFLLMGFGDRAEREAAARC